jgi:holo-[acyl-carrier protein] synthase
VGAGTDICEIARVAAVFARFDGRFKHRILTPAERTERPWKAADLAKRWAAKEAVAKALGTGIGGQVGFHDIEILRTGKGALACTVRGQSHVKFHVSVSDDGAYAIAFCVVEQA